MLNTFTTTARIAYFSMEVALKSEIPTYSGGLGVLAGDTLRSAADLELPFVVVSLVSREGYFRQEIDTAGRQVELPDAWEPSQWAEALGAKIAVKIEGREVWIRAWLYMLKGHMNGAEPVLLLDTDMDENHPDDRRITHHLYGGDESYRLKQEIVLGIGGVRMLRALGFKIRKYHLNEGHSALLGLELLQEFAYPQEDLRPGESPYDLPRVRELCNFTTHTPIESGHDKFSYEQVSRVLGEVIDPGVLRSLAGAECLNMTRLALNMSEHINGVAQRHAEVSRKMFPGYHVDAVTNGVHPYTWTHPAFRVLYGQYIPGWCHEPGMMVRADLIPDEVLWQAHLQAKNELIKKVAALTSVQLNPEAAILGFARRMTAYKRPDLIFSDIDRLKTIAKQRPFQIIMAGKAHPRDEGGKKLIAVLHEHIAQYKDWLTMVYLPNYDMNIAQAMTSGVDIWLNTPLRPLEASGTSGMKAAFNGVPSLSVLDGWWIEGCIEGVTGWAVGSEIESSNGGDVIDLYYKLAMVVLPQFYEDRPGWLRLMKGVIGKNASFFNSHRMMRSYTTEAYLR